MRAHRVELKFVPIEETASDTIADPTAIFHLGTFTPMQLECLSHTRPGAPPGRDKRAPPRP